MKLTLDNKADPKITRRPRKMYFFPIHLLLLGVIDFRGFWQKFDGTRYLHIMLHIHTNCVTYCCSIYEMSCLQKCLKIEKNKLTKIQFWKFSKYDAAQFKGLGYIHKLVRGQKPRRAEAPRFWQLGRKPRNFKK